MFAKVNEEFANTAAARNYDRVNYHGRRLSPLTSGATCALVVLFVPLRGGIMRAVVVRRNARAALQAVLAARRSQRLGSE